MKIADIRDPAVFQRLVHRLMVAERGADFHIPDDSGGDRGNDGYDADRGILYAIYCPEKPATADYRNKGLKDLQKAVHLAAQPGYSIKKWVFVTPTSLREQLQAELRAIEAALLLRFPGWLVAFRRRRFLPAQCELGVCPANRVGRARLLATEAAAPVREAGIAAALRVA